MTERLDVEFDETMATVAEPATDAPKERHWGRKLAAITAVAALGLGASACGGGHEGGEQPNGNGQPTVGNTNTPGSEQSPSGQGAETHERTEPAGTVVLDKKGYLKVWPKFGTMSRQAYEQLFDNPFLASATSNDEQPVHKLVVPHDYAYKLSLKHKVSELYTQNPFKHFDKSTGPVDYNIQHGILTTDAKTVGNALASMTEFMTTPQEVPSDKVAQELHQYYPAEVFNPNNYPTADDLKQYVGNKDTLGLYKALTGHIDKIAAPGSPSLDEIYIDALIAKYENGQTNDSDISNILASAYENFVLSPYASETANFKSSATTFQEVTQKLQAIDTSSPAGKQAALKFLKKERADVVSSLQKMEGITYEVKGAELLQDESEYFGNPANHKGLKSLMFEVQTVYFDPTAEQGHQYSLINQVQRWLVTPFPGQGNQKRFLSLQSDNINLDEGQNNVWNTSQQAVEAKLQQIQSNATK